METDIFNFWGKLVNKLLRICCIFLLQVHKKLGNTHLALMYFSWASDLDPKGVNSQVKEAIMGPGQGDDESPATQSGKTIFGVSFQYSINAFQFW